MENNKFIVKFPVELNIPEYITKKISKIKIKDGVWKNIKLKMYIPINPNITHSVFNLLSVKDIEFNIVSVDSKGETIDIWNIEVGKIISIDFDNKCDWNSDKRRFQTIKIKIKPKNCKLI